MHCRIHLLCALTSVVFGAQAQSGAYDALACDSAEMKPGCPADLDRDRVVDDTDFRIFVLAYANMVCPTE